MSGLSVNWIEVVELNMQVSCSNNRMRYKWADFKWPSSLSSSDCWQLVGRSVKRMWDCRPSTMWTLVPSLDLNNSILKLQVMALTLDDSNSVAWASPLWFKVGLQCNNIRWHDCTWISRHFNTFDLNAGAFISRDTWNGLRSLVGGAHESLR